MGRPYDQAETSQTSMKRALLGALFVLKAVAAPLEDHQRCRRTYISCSERGIGRILKIQNLKNTKKALFLKN